MFEVKISGWKMKVDHAGFQGVSTGWLLASKIKVTSGSEHHPFTEKT